jgi:hypothetical protein
MDSKAVLALWKKISKCVADEISGDAEFCQKIADIFPGEGSETKPRQAPGKTEKTRRRAPAKIDPFASFENGEEALKSALGGLSAEELKDVIAGYGMDTARVAMKWRSRERLAGHIISMTKLRASHGGAFWRSENI